MAEEMQDAEFTAKWAQECQHFQAEADVEPQMEARFNAVVGLLRAYRQRISAACLRQAVDRFNTTYNLRPHREQMGLVIVGYSWVVRCSISHGLLVTEKAANDAFFSAKMPPDPGELMNTAVRIARSMRPLPAVGAEEVLRLRKSQPHGDLPAREPLEGMAADFDREDQERRAPAPEPPAVDRPAVSSANPDISIASEPTGRAAAIPPSMPTWRTAKFWKWPVWRRDFWVQNTDDEPAE